MSRARKGTHVPDAERCRAMSSKSAGARCPNRIAEGVLCRQHVRWGAIIPDDWTQPDNIPVWFVPKPKPPQLWDRFDAELQDTIEASRPVRRTG